MRAARTGSAEALGRLFEECRQFLLLIANQELAADLKPKVAPSDLVQETFLEAQQRFRRFTGQTDAELLAWLRQILLNNLRDATRRYRHAGKRRLGRERNLSCSDELRVAAHSSADTPGRLTGRMEDQARLRQALAQLSNDHRRVIELRNLEVRSFVEIGRLMDRTPDAVRKLWGRALFALEQQLGAADVG
ncbi:MAG: sigma-70 family RNA polymerase sigma factor [Planctomycetaceae bacterium]